MSATLAILILSSLTLSAVGQTVSYRLPTSVLPDHYTLTVDTDLTHSTFSGSVVINVNVTQITDTIVMHSRGLSLSGFSVLLTNINIFNRFELVPATDFLRIFLSHNVTAGSFLKVGISFNGTLGTENVGFYRASYVNELNQTRFLAVTQFESTDARRAFPCFDQPNLKATFQINLIRSNQLITASNAQLMNTIIENPIRRRDIFATTPRMSTFLVAYMVSDYDNNTVVATNIRYSTFGRREQIQRNEAAYSLVVAPEAVWVMSTFTTVPYLLPKLDQVSVPNEYYNNGAMENWGMLTYREKYLMYNPNTSTASEQQYTATIISHEVAHQWFGNLVTPQWWRYIWLSEGFATYFENYIGERVQSTWGMIDQIVTTTLHPALEDDAVNGTKPMTRDAESPDEIEALFDTSVYEKAASVIRMAHGFLGDGPFTNGIGHYVRSGLFGNVVPQNLYAAWQAFMPLTLNVSNIMTSWEMQAGYPVVTVTRSGNAATLTQERFFINAPTSNDLSLWQIPITWVTNAVVSNVTWFNTRTAVVNINVPPNAWVVFNWNQAGFYRVNYDNNNWQLIRNFLWTGNFAAIPVRNRAQLVDDAFNLARSGRLNHSIAFDIGSYVRNETALVPILAFTRALAHLDRLFTGNTHHNAIRNYGIANLEPYFLRTGFILQNDAHQVKLTKVPVLTWLCNFGHLPCRNHARQAFVNWIGTNALIQPDSQSFVFCNGIRTGTVAEWETALQRYGQLREDTQRGRIASGLGCAPTEALLQRLVNLVADQNSVFSRSHRQSAITSVYTNNGIIGVNVVLRSLAANFTAINQTIGDVSSIVEGVTNRITNPQQVTLFNQFVNQNRQSFTAKLNATINTSLATANRNMQWVNSTSPQIADHFAPAPGLPGPGLPGPVPPAPGPAPPAPGPAPPAPGPGGSDGNDATATCVYCHVLMIGCILLLSQI